MTKPLTVRALLLGRPADLPKIPRHRVIVSIVVIILSGAIGFGLTRLAQTAFSPIEVKIADDSGHRTPPTPLPTSPFR
jgi:hypothetical protein